MTDAEGPLRLVMTVGLLQFSETVVSVGLFTVPLYAPLAAAELGVALNLVGWFAAIVFVGATASSVACSALIARFGPIRITQTSLAAMAVSLGLVMAGATAAFAVSALLMGLAYGVLSPASTQILARITPPRLFGLVFSVRQTGNPLGGILAGILVPMLVYWAGWRGASFAVATMSLLMLVPLWPLRRSYDPGRIAMTPLRAADMLRPAWEVLKNPRLRTLVLAGFPCGALQTCLSTFLVALLVEDAGFNLIAAGVTMSVAQGFGLLGRLLWGTISGLWVEGQFLFGLLAILMSASAGATLLLSPSVPVVAYFAFAALFGATATGWGGLFIAELAKRAAPGGAARAAGGASALSFAGCVAGPMAFAWIVSATGSYGYGFAAVGATTLLAGIALLVLPRDHYGQGRATR